MTGGRSRRVPLTGAVVLAVALSTVAVLLARDRKSVV